MRHSPHKRRAVARLLARPEWRQRSTNWIARTAGVSWAFADKVRTQLGAGQVQVLTQSGRRVAATQKRMKGFFSPRLAA